MTSQEEKRIALKNAIYNYVTLNHSHAFEMQQIFLSYIDVFTIAHLKLLHFLTNPRDWFIKHEQKNPILQINARWFTIRDAIIVAYPELGNQMELVDAIWMDLYSKHLLYGDKRMLDDRPPPTDKRMLHIILPPRDVLSCHATSLGEQFVTFISE